MGVIVLKKKLADTNFAETMGIGQLCVCPDKRDRYFGQFEHSFLIFHMKL